MSTSAKTVGRDRRASALRHLNVHYKYTPPRTKEEWVATARALRQHILVSCGLYPEPPRAPLRAKVFGRLERDGYSVEKAYFESRPGLLVTGNLYRPLGGKGKRPGILCPHGHWGEGRFGHDDTGSVSGRCLNFARQGYVVFSYDMLGYNDSGCQVEHRWGGQREALYGAGTLALQLWNSMRAVDFIESLPDVDPSRIGVTGASGGGTQTFMLCAAEDRVKVCAPVNMISLHMQGGCLCENASNLRLDANNVEIGGLMAPRPMLMVSCTGDWTKFTPTEEFPATREIYRLLDAEANVSFIQVDGGHNYNPESCEAVYKWFAQHLLGKVDPEKCRYLPFEREPKDNLLIFGKRKPPKHLVRGAAITKLLIDESESQLAKLKPISKAMLTKFKELMGPALRCATATSLRQGNALKRSAVQKTEAGEFSVETFYLGRKGMGDAVPCAVFVPTAGAGTAEATLVVHETGMTDLFRDGKVDQPGTLLAKLLKAGQTVMTIDTFSTGSATPDERPGMAAKQEVRYFETYNRTASALRVQDILTALAYLRSLTGVTGVHLAGLRKAGLWALLAAGLSGEVDSLACDCSGFRNTSDEAYLKDLYIPSIRRAGDFRTAATLHCPRPLLLHNAAGSFKTTWMRDVYRAVGPRGALVVETKRASNTRLAEWILACE